MIVFREALKLAREIRESARCVSFAPVRQKVWFSDTDFDPRVTEELESIFGTVKNDEIYSH